MAGNWGSSAFGVGPFGHAWGQAAIVEAPPEVYKQQDLDVGDGMLRAFLEGVHPSMGAIVQKIRDFDSLRDPLECPSELDFVRAVTILRTQNLGDGTSRVFLSVGLSGTKYESLRPGMTLTDVAGRIFTITQIVSAALASEVTNAPFDPTTADVSPQHVIVRNLGQGSVERIPYVTSAIVPTPIVTGEDPPGDNPSDASFVTTHDNGTYAGPYTFRVGYPTATQIAENRVKVSWEEDGLPKFGVFANDGTISGDLGAGSSVSYSATTNVGYVTVATKRGAVIDGDSIRINYTAVESPLVDDAEIRGQNILAFLASDFDVALDRNDPEHLQRSSVYHAYQLWDIKGTELSYEILGKMAGYFVKAVPLYKINADYAVSLGVDTYELPPDSGQSFTTTHPGRPYFDEMAADIVPLDSLCSSFPVNTQAITVTDVSLLQNEGAVDRYTVTATSTQLDRFFGTEGLFTDFATDEFGVQNPERHVDEDDNIYVTFEVTSAAAPVTGAGTIDWNVAKVDLTVIGVGTDVVEVGTEYADYEGKRYRITKAISGFPVSDAGHWKFIDADGVSSYLEVVGATSTPGTYFVEIISATAPPAGAAHIYYECEINTTCNYCRASLLLFHISEAEIASYPEALQGQALQRLMNRIYRLVPAHVRAVAYIVDAEPLVYVDLPTRQETVAVLSP